MRLRVPEAVGVTLSGSGPAVVVWADAADSTRIAANVSSELGAAATVLPLAVAREGAAAQVR